MGSQLFRCEFLHFRKTFMFWQKACKKKCLVAFSLYRQLKFLPGKSVKDLDQPWIAVHQIHSVALQEPDKQHFDVKSMINLLLYLLMTDAAFLPGSCYYTWWQLLVYLQLPMWLIIYIARFTLPGRCYWIRQILLTLVADIQPGSFRCPFQQLLATATGSCYLTWELLLYLETAANLPEADNLFILQHALFYWIRQLLLDLVAAIQPGSFFCTFQPLLVTLTGSW
jgi:hypothetical protein